MNQIPEDIAFGQSYVLDLRITPYQVECRMDFELLPSHPRYCNPMKRERACFKKGSIRISGFTELTWVASGFAPATDARREVDWGCLDEFAASDGCWRLAGDWGNIEIKGGNLELVID